MFPGEVEHLLGHEPVQYVEGLVEHLETLSERGQIDAEGFVLTFVPTRTHSELEPASRHAIEGHRLLGQQGRMAKRVGGHHRPESDPIGHCETAKETSRP